MSTLRVTEVAAAAVPATEGEGVASAMVANTDFLLYVCFAD